MKIFSSILLVFIAQYSLAIDCYQKGDIKATGSFRVLETKPATVSCMSAENKLESVSLANCFLILEKADAPQNNTLSVVASGEACSWKKEQLVKAVIKSCGCNYRILSCSNAKAHDHSSAVVACGTKSQAYLAEFETQATSKKAPSK